jgi:hypothetical protein
VSPYRSIPPRIPTTASWLARRAASRTTTSTSAMKRSAYLILDADRGCVAVGSYGSAGCARGTQWGARTRPYRRDRCRLRDRLEGALPHRRCRICLRRSQYPPNQNHPGIPHASTRTRRARLKFQIFLARSLSTQLLEIVRSSSRAVSKLLPLCDAAPGRPITTKTIEEPPKANSGSDLTSSSLRIRSGMHSRSICSSPPS